MKICVYTICKNEEKNVARWLQSAQEADIICISDTGSTDRTVELLEQNPKVHLIHGKYTGENFRFDYARNEVLDIIPEDTDLCIMLDLDCFLTAGWRALLEEYFNQCQFVRDPQEAYWVTCQIIEFAELQRKTKYGLEARTLGHFYDKTARYVRAVHEDLFIPDKVQHVFNIPESVLIMIHDPNKAESQRKLVQYRNLAYIEFLEFPTYQAALILLMELWGELNESQKSLLLPDLKEKDKAEFSLEILNKALSIPVSEQNRMWYERHNDNSQVSQKQTGSLPVSGSSVPDSPLECLLMYYCVVRSLNKTSDYLEKQIIDVFNSQTRYSRTLIPYLWYASQNFLNSRRLSPPEFLKTWNPEIAKIFQELLRTFNKEATD